MSMNHQCINSDDNLISLTKIPRHYRLLCEIKQKTVSYSNRSYLLLNNNKFNTAVLLHSSDTASTTQSTQTTSKTIPKVKKTVNFGSIDIIDYHPNEIIDRVTYMKNHKENVQCQCVIF